MKTTLSQKYNIIRNKSLNSLSDSKNQHPGTLLDKVGFDSNYIIQFAATFGYLLALEELDTILSYNGSEDIEEYRVVEKVYDKIFRYMENRLEKNMTFIIPFSNVK